MRSTIVYMSLYWFAGRRTGHVGRRRHHDLRGPAHLGEQVELAVHGAAGAAAGVRAGAEPALVLRAAAVVAAGEGPAHHRERAVGTLLVGQRAGHDDPDTRAAVVRRAQRAHEHPAVEVPGHRPDLAALGGVPDGAQDLGVDLLRAGHVERDTLLDPEPGRRLGLTLAARSLSAATWATDDRDPTRRGVGRGPGSEAREDGCHADHRDGHPFGRHSISPCVAGAATGVRGGSPFVGVGCRVGQAWQALSACLYCSLSIRLGTSLICLPVTA